jgi:phage-related protein
MTIKLVKLPDIEKDWQTEYNIRALSISGKSPALDYLAKLKKNDINNYKKLLKVIKLVGTQKRVHNIRHVKKEKTGKEVYEMRVNKSYPRLFFFYDFDSIVICTHGFDKKGDKKKQNKEFENAEIFYKYYINKKFSR